MVNELKELLGIQVCMPVGGVLFAVVVKDARVCWGKTQVLVEPVAGKGTTWKDLSNLTNAAGEPLIKFGG